MHLIFNSFLMQVELKALFRRNPSTCRRLAFWDFIVCIDEYFFEINELRSQANEINVIKHD